MASILIVEDDRHTRMLTRLHLKNEYDIFEAANGREALEILDAKAVDLIVADVMMPQMDGYELVRTLRGERRMIPVIFLSARREWADKKVGFSAGIDDYMTKPVNYEELLWRIKALLRRSRISGEKRIVIGEVTICAERYSVSRGGMEQVLPKKEFELLYKLLSYPGVVFTKMQLLDEIWGYDSESDENTIKTHISRLRSRFGSFTEFRIVTVRGLGYKGEIKE